MTRAIVAFGGNLGEVHQSFVQARQTLAQTDGVEIMAVSNLYRTPPLGPAGQPDYLNAAVAVETDLSPLQLLDLLQQIEAQHGRTRGERWGARTLDLDIIAYDGEQLASERLTLPHAHMHERMFVLCPLCDIDANWQHPLLKLSAEQLMHRLLAAGESPLPEGEIW